MEKKSSDTYPKKNFSTFFFTIFFTWNVLQHLQKKIANSEKKYMFVPNLLTFFAYLSDSKKQKITGKNTVIVSEIKK